MKQARRWRSSTAAKAATTTIPVVFGVAQDPVALGLVASLARPGSNLTGISFFNTELAAKRLELLPELVPAATRVAVLVNPTSAANTATTLRDVEAAARAIGLQIQVFNASTSREIDAAFANFARERLRQSRPLFPQPACPFGPPGDALRGPHYICARDYAEAGGLMSYGASLTDAYRASQRSARNAPQACAGGDFADRELRVFEVAVDSDQKSSRCDT